MRPRSAQSQPSLARRIAVSLLALSLALGPVAPAALANPEDGSVVVGAAEFGGTPTDMVIETATDRTVIDWKSFDVEVGESVEFLQPGEWSAVLNRVLGVRASSIEGAISSNGRVYIANEGGVYFGGNAIVDVAQLVAAAGSITNEDFVAGIDHFQNLRGGVLNAGEIRADGVTLAGQWVSNQGTIVVDDGALLMLAGDEVWVTEVGSPILIQLTTSSGAPDGAADVENSGTLDAGRGRVRLAAGDPLGISIRNSGAIRARQITLEGQDLVQVSGTLDASASGDGEVGGDIQVLGERVALLGAELDASGDGGGGSVLVGGDTHGGGGIRRARYTHVSEDSQLRADAGREGDGGRVVVWADHTAQVRGEISARGGSEGGDGGFAETSGRRMLEVEQTPDLSAANGLGGEWLIDPSNIEIVADGSVANEPPQSLDPAFDSEFFDGVLQATEDTAQVSAGLIVDALSDGVSVVVTTETFLDLGNAEGNIVVKDEIRVTDSDRLILGSLSLLAANDVVLEAAGAPDPMTMEPDTAGQIVNELDRALNVLIVANDGLQEQASEADSFIGDVTLDADIQTGGGVLQINAVNLIAKQSIDTDGGFVRINTVGGDFEVESGASIATGGGELNVLAASAATEADDGTTSGGQIRIASGATVDSEGGDVLLSSDGGDILLFQGGPDGMPDAPLRTGGGEVIVDARVDMNVRGGRVVVDDRIDSTGADDDPGGDQRYDADQSVTLNAAITTGGGDLIIGADGDAGDVFIDADVTTLGGSVTSVGDDFTFREDATIDTTGPDDNGDLRFTHRGAGVVEGGVQLTASAVNLRAGQDGIGDLTFASGRAGPGRPNGAAPQGITADTVVLAAGDGYTAPGPRPEGETEDPALEARRLAQVDLGNLTITPGLMPGDPTTLQILQDADLDAAELVSLLPGATPDSYTLQAADGTVRVADPNLFVGSDLTLIAKNDVAVENPLVGIASIDIQTAEDFVVTQALATQLAPANQISIQSGLGSRIESVSDELGTGVLDISPAVSGDLTLLADVTLLAQGVDSRIDLRGGVSGVGDLVFESNVTLQADAISLRAGAADDPTTVTGTEQAKIFAVGQPVPPVFRRAPDGSAPFQFGFRQDAEIANADIPERSQLGGDLSETTYTLRSDLGSVTIGAEPPGTPPAPVATPIATLEQQAPVSASALPVANTPTPTAEQPATLLASDAPVPRVATKVDDSHLVVLANTGINFDQQVLVQSSDVGGIVNLHVTQDVLGGIQSPMNQDVVLRAGTNGVGILSFDSDLTVRGDEIQLVSGDGFGGQIASASIAIDSPNDPDYVAPRFRSTNDDDRAPNEFVFQQDAAIDDIDFAVLPEPEQFGDDGPLVYGIRSDDASIEIGASTTIVTGPGQLVVSAQRIDVSQLDADLLFDIDGRGVELRGDTIVLSAAASPEPAAIDMPTTPTPTTEQPATVTASTPVSTRPRVDASSLRRITGFEGSDSDAGDFDPGTFPLSRPLSFAIAQDGAIYEDMDGSFGLPDANLFEDSIEGMNYTVISNKASIQIDDPASVAGTRLSLGITKNADIEFPMQALPLESLIASSQYELEVSQGANLIVEELLVLAGGQSGTGELRFAPNVRLTANTLILDAGDGSTTPAPEGELPVAPRIDARSNDPEFVLVPTMDDESELRFVSDAEVVLVDDPTTAPETASLLPVASQLDEGDIDLYEVQSDEGLAPSPEEAPLASIRISDFRFADFGNATKVVLDARSVFVGSSGDLDLRSDPAPDGTQELELRALVVDLAGREVFTEDPTVMDAADELLQLRGPEGSFEGSPRTFTISQTEDVRADNLPELGQFGSGLRFLSSDGEGGAIVRNVEYALESTGGDIEVDPAFADKVVEADLTLQTIDSRETRVSSDLDLFSLTAVTPVRFQTTIDQSPPEEPDPDTAPEVTTETSQTYAGKITLDTPMTELSGGRVQILAAVDSATPGDSSLVLSGSEEVVIAADVGAGTPLGSLEVNITDPSGFLEFGGIVNAPAGATEEQIQQLLEAPISVTTTDGISLNPDGRATIPATAGIFKRFGDLSLRTGGDFETGTNSKISVGGSLEISSCDLADCEAGGTGRVRVGDLSALELTLRADVLEVMRRGSGPVQINDGSIQTDAGVDLLANDFTLAINQLEFSGAGDNPLLGIPNGPAPAPPIPLPVAEGRTGGRPLGPGDFGMAGDPEQLSTELIPGTNFQVNLNLFSRSDDVVLDLRPEGASRADLTEIYNTPVPAPTDGAPFPWRPDTAPLGAVGVAVRNATTAELASWTSGAAVYDDVSGGASRMGGIVLVAEPRVIAGEAREALEAYRQAFGPNHERVGEVRSVLERVLDDYLRETGARKVVGFELRRYVRNRPSSQYEAYQLLEELDALHRHHRDLGLSPAEYRQIQRRWLEEITPEGISVDELAEVIHPSRYVRGSDILDLFGQ